MPSAVLPDLGFAIFVNTERLITVSSTELQQVQTVMENFANLAPLPALRGERTRKQQRIVVVGDQTHGGQGRSVLKIAAARIANNAAQSAVVEALLSLPNTVNNPLPQRILN